MDNSDNLGSLSIDGSNYRTRISRKFENRTPYKPVNPKLVLSFIPGTVLDIFVSEGQSVSAGDELMILDAMKMQNRLTCGMPGKVKKIYASKGDRVAKGTVLIELE